MRTHLILLLVALCLLIGGASAVSWTSANGCWTATDGDYTIVMWNQTGNHSWPVPEGVNEVEDLVVGGGGAGGAGQAGVAYSCGGGGGEINASNGLPVSGTITVTVGTAGIYVGPTSVGGNGGSSAFGSIFANGGYAGGTITRGVGGNSGIGYNGGAKNASNLAGGGGAGNSHNGYVSVGTYGGNGGDGNSSSISGITTYYAGGGAGEAPGAVIGANGLGGGHSFYGGGGECDSSGGSGVVIIRYLTPSSSEGVSFTATPTTGLSPISVQFNDTTSTLASSWQWNYTTLSDAIPVTFSTEQNATHEFTTGNYSISLYANTTTWSTASTQTTWINVSELAPIADFTQNTSSGFYPLAVQFNDTSTLNPTAWSWSFGDGAYASEQNTSHTYSSGGNFTVTLTVHNINATQSSQIGYVEIWNYTSVSFSGAPLAGNVPLTVTFTDTSENATSWYWIFGDGGTSTSRNPTHTYDVGSYTVNHSASNGRHTSWYNQTDYITVSETPPVASFTQTTLSSAINFTTIQFSDTSTRTPDSWIWNATDLSGNNTPFTFNTTSGTPIHSFTKGNYVIELIATNSAGANTSTQSNWVNVTVIPPLIGIAPYPGDQYVASAGAQNITQSVSQVGSYSVTAESGYVIYEIIVEDLPIGANQTHVLNYRGQSFLLEIGTYSTLYFIKNVDITLTMPNGTVQTAHTSATWYSGNYRTLIQPVDDLSTDLFSLKIDLLIGLSPASAQFYATPAGWTVPSTLPFSSASGSFTALSDVKVKQKTLQQFTDDITNYDPTKGISEWWDDLFQWTWGMILAFMYGIPVLGPIMVGFIDLAGIILTELYFWLSFIVLNFPAILLSIETLIMMMAAINAGSGKRSLGRLAHNIYEYNVAVIHGFIYFADVVRGWIATLVEIVTSIVNALKPI